MQGKQSQSLMTVNQSESQQNKPLKRQLPMIQVMEDLEIDECEFENMSYQADDNGDLDWDLALEEIERDNSVQEQDALNGGRNQFSNQCEEAEKNGTQGVMKSTINQVRMSCFHYRGEMVLSQFKAEHSVAQRKFEDEVKKYTDFADILQLTYGCAGKKTGFDYDDSDDDDKHSSSSSIDFSPEMSSSNVHQIESPSCRYKQNPLIRQTLNGDFKLQSSSSGMHLQFQSSSSRKELELDVGDQVGKAGEKNQQIFEVAQLVDEKQTVKYKKVDNFMEACSQAKKQACELKMANNANTFKNLVCSPRSENMLTTHGMKTEGSKYCCSSKKQFTNQLNEELEQFASFSKLNQVNSEESIELCSENSLNSRKQQAAYEKVISKMLKGGAADFSVSIELGLESVVDDQ
ncbi:hypothetical protein FGO68_gene16268 [Halteria grandinella]|uniref:Uncharacterized protein n=1 Tax=Halteria grandinella TaxID=5974 RepID=A0A8J8NWP7_HALGN|nr:hypothetical protein FGO68_gene16268 [Halteria grandinella]